MADTQTLDNTIQQVKTFIVENASEFLINILFAFIIFYLGKKIAKVITKVSLKMMQKAKLDDVLCSFLSTLVNSKPFIQHPKMF